MEKLEQVTETARANPQGQACEGLQLRLPLSATGDRLMKLCQHVPILTGSRMDLVGLSLWILKAMTSLNGSGRHVSNRLGRVY